MKNEALALIFGDVVWVFGNVLVTVYKDSRERWHHEMSSTVDETPKVAALSAAPAAHDETKAVAPEGAQPNAMSGAAAAVEAVASAAGVTGDESTSLATLLEHIENLNNSNKQMSETLKIIETRNMERFHQVVGTKIEPWVKSLNIPVEQQQSFIKGIEVACEQGHKRGIVDFEMNPAYSIACAAATAYGKQVEEVEKARQEINLINTNLKASQVDQNKQASNQRNIVNANVATICSDIKLGKRSHEDMYTNNLKEDVNEVSTCWSTVYDNMRSS